MDDTAGINDQVSLCPSQMVSYTTGTCSASLKEENIIGKRLKGQNGIYKGIVCVCTCVCVHVCVIVGYAESCILLI